MKELTSTSNHLDPLTMQFLGVEWVQEIMNSVFTNLFIVFLFNKENMVKNFLSGYRLMETGNHYSRIN